VGKVADVKCRAIVRLDGRPNSGPGGPGFGHGLGKRISRISCGARSGAFSGGSFLSTAGDWIGAESRYLLFSRNLTEV